MVEKDGYNELFCDFLGDTYRLHRSKDRAFFFDGSERCKGKTSSCFDKMSSTTLLLFLDSETNALNPEK